MNFDVIYNILSRDAFISVNKTLARKIGLIPTVILSELISEQKYWTIREQLDENGYFFSTVKNLKENIGIKRGQQDKSIDILIKLGLVSKITKGMPRKRFFKINPYEVFRLLSEDEEENFLEIDLTKVNKNVKIFIDKFKKAYKEINRDYFNFLNLSEEYLVTKEDLNALMETNIVDLEKMQKSFDDINYTIEHSRAFDNWKSNMSLSIKLLLKVPFRFISLLEFSDSI